MRKYFIAIFTILLVISSCKFKDSILTEAPADTTSTTTSTSIKVLTPNGGETISEGSNFSITWSSTSKSLMRITFSYDNGSTWILVADSLKNTGVFNWFPVPNNISNQCIVRVLSVDGVYSDASDKVFAIIRNSNESLNILSPKEKDEWEAGTSKQIKWYSSGLDSIKIEYTTNNGTSWNSITTDRKNTGIYYWDPIPNTPSVLAKVRIKDAKDGQPSSESQIFSILPEPKLKVLSPNGKEKILAGTSRKLEWLSENVERVKIAYTTNNGFNWVSIAESTPSTGFYVWEPVPNVNSQLCKIRVADAKDSQPFDMSDSVFTITNLISQTIEITTPNGGERWQAGTSQNLTWQSSGIQKVKIELTSNNGLTWNVVADNVSNTGAYEWNVPNSLSTQCLIRISDAQDGDPTDQSNGLFRIVPKPELKIIYPNGGETWTAGVVDTIRWQSIGVENVIIESSSNNGITWFTVVEKTPSSGSYVTSFTKEGTEYKIRIHDKENGSPQDESDGTFTVSPEPKITVVSPNGNEEWHAGSSDNITWKSNNIEFVRIDYTTNNGATWFNITDKTPSDGVYSWSPIPSVSSLLCRVKISDYKDGLPADISDENFSIIYPGNQLIKVTLPNGGEKWAAGSSQNIKWDAAGITNVKIEYTTNNGINWNVITNSTESDGFYTWVQVPNNASTQCKIRISDALDSSPSDESDAFFSIDPEPSIKILTPNGGETWSSGSSKEIRWISESIENVKIEYTTNGGFNWNVIVASSPSIGYYTWNNIPNINSLQCKIKISDADDGNPSDLSDANFTISNLIEQSIRLESPNGGEKWQAGTSKTIKWVSIAVNNVNIHFTTNNGLTWTAIATNHPSTGSYEWNPVPSVNSAQCKIKISDASDGEPFDECNSNFAIQPIQTIQVTYPFQGEAIMAGKKFNITWNSSGVEFVKIEYNYKNSILQSDWVTLVDSVPSSGSYEASFSIVSDTYVIKISDASDGSPSDFSDGVFMIQAPPTIQLLVPNKDEQWLVNEMQEIKWRATNLSNVKIEWSTTGGGTWNTVRGASNTVNDGSFHWVPADELLDPDGLAPDSSDNCRIRITSADPGITASDVTDEYFSIHKSRFLRVDFPNNGEDFYPPEDLTNPKASIKWPMLIKWTSYAVANVNIFYSLDNGVSWAPLIANYQSTGAYGWDFIFGTVIEPKVSTLGRIKVVDSAHPGTFDINDVPFWLNVQKN